MMKKKKAEQAHTMHNNQNKTTDNKESDYTSQNYNGEIIDSMSSGASENFASENDTESAKKTDNKASEVRAVEEKLAEMQDKYIRLSAEFDNYRKRTLREKMDMSKYAGENLLLKIIPIMDDFERALSHMDSATDCAAMKSGIDLIYGKFSEFLKQSGVKEIESLNSTFDVDLHEAVAKIPAPEEDKKGKVMDVIQKGYYLQDKVLRFSKVVVGE